MVDVDLKKIATVAQNHLKKLILQKRNFIKTPRSFSSAYHITVFLLERRKKKNLIVAATPFQKKLTIFVRFKVHLHVRFNLSAFCSI